MLLEAYRTRDEAEVTVPDGVTQILPNAFRDHGEIEVLHLPESLQSIGAGAFRGCTSLREVIIPEAVFEIGEEAFSGCCSLHAVQLPEGLLEVPASAFALCSALEEVRGGEDVYRVGDGAFRRCASLRILPGFPRWEIVGSEAFAGCSRLLQAVLPDSMRLVGREAFRGCVAVEFASLPDSIEELGKNVFSGCARLKEIEGSDLLVGRFPDAFPRSIVHSCGLLRNQDRYRDEHAYWKAHALEIDEIRGALDDTKEEQRRLVEESGSLGIMERTRRKRLEREIERVRKRQRVLGRRLDELHHPSDGDLLAMIAERRAASPDSLRVREHAQDTSDK